MRKTDAPQSKQRLSFEKANAVSHALAEVGEHLFDFMNELKRSDFSAFVPRLEFTESFAANSEELKVHQTFLKEAAKYYLSRWAHAQTSQQLEKLYVSSFLQSLLLQQDQVDGRRGRRFYRHVAGDEPISVPELDPCVRRMLQYERENKLEFDCRQAEVLKASRDIFLKELKVHSTGLSQNFTMNFPSKAWRTSLGLNGRDVTRHAPKGVNYLADDLKSVESNAPDRLAFIREVLVREGKALGFAPDNGRSRPLEPVFSRQISAEWDLCISLENETILFFRPDEGSIFINLTLRDHSLARLPKQGEALLIDFESIIPNFLASYTKF